MWWAWSQNSGLLTGRSTPRGIGTGDSCDFLALPGLPKVKKTFWKANISIETDQSLATCILDIVYIKVSPSLPVSATDAFVVLITCLDIMFFASWVRVEVVPLVTWANATAWMVLALPHMVRHCPSRGFAHVVKPLPDRGSGKWSPTIFFYNNRENDISLDVCLCRDMLGLLMGRAQKRDP